MNCQSIPQLYPWALADCSVLPAKGPARQRLFPSSEPSSWHRDASVGVGYSSPLIAQKLLNEQSNLKLKDHNKQAKHVAHDRHSSNGNVEAGRLEVQGHPLLYSTMPAWTI